MKAVKPVPQGMKRSYMKCRECGEVYYYDYIPYGISNPLRWTDCGHSIGAGNDLNCDTITEGEFEARMELNALKKEAMPEK